MIIFTHQAHAAARSNVAMDYLYRNPTLKKFTVGFYGGEMKRDITLFGMQNTTISSTRYYGYLGYDIARWINLYGILGSNDATLPNTSAMDSELLYGVGLSFNLLNHSIREPTPMEDAIRVNGDLRMISTKAEFPSASVSWQEISGSLRFSLVNFPIGDKRYRPEAIALYAGPAFSFIQSDDVEAKQEFGFIGGLEVFFFDSFSLDLHVENYDTSSVFGGINIRF